MDRSGQPCWAAHLPPGLDVGSVDLLRGGNLAAVAIAGWQDRGSDPCLRDVDGRWLSGNELVSRTAGVASRLVRQGLRPGDRVMLEGEPSAAFVCAYLGVLRAGMVAVPFNPGYTRAEVERLVQAARPARTLLAGDQAVVEDGPSAAVGELELDVADSRDPALLLFTSGTTGTPKGAVLSHGNLLSSARAVTLAWRWTPADRLLLTLPLFHMHGLGVGLNGWVVAGAQLSVRRGFAIADVEEQAAEGTTMFFGVPAIYQRLLSAGRAGALRGLRLIVSGSAPLSSEASDALAAATGQRPLERYGMTETVMITSNLVDGPRKPGRVGLPLPGVELRLGADGEVQVRGPNVLGGYDSGIGDAEAFTGDGWFRTGDLGEFDADGHLRLVGRSKELIITGGFNVHPREVEEVLAAFPGVAEVAVVGRPNERWGEAVTAVVVAEAPVEVEALLSFARSRLVGYKVPKAVEFVDELPRNALGKVMRGEL